MAKIEVVRYLGGNEYIDMFIEEGEVWWIVNGASGRLPIEAGTREEALNIYKERDKARKKRSEL